MFSTKSEIRHFHVVVVHRQQKNVQKSMMHDGEDLLFCQSKLIAFSPFSLMLSLLKLPIIPVWEGGQILNGMSLINKLLKNV